MKGGGLSPTPFSLRTEGNDSRLDRTGLGGMEGTPALPKGSTTLVSLPQLAPCMHVYICICDFFEFVLCFCS